MKEDANGDCQVRGGGGRGSKNERNVTVGEHFPFLSLSLGERKTTIFHSNNNAKNLLRSVS